MDVTEIPEFLKKIWNTIVPPVVEAVLSITLIWGLLGYPILSLNAMIGIRPEQLIPSDSVREVLTFYGISSLIPIAILLSLYAIAQMTAKIIHWIGDHLPIHVIENSTALMVHVADEWMLRKLWLCHPGLYGINGINTARLLIREAIIKAKTDPNAHHYMKARTSEWEVADRYKNRFNFSKGLILISIITWITTEIFGKNNCSIGTFSMIVFALIVFSIFSILKHIDTTITRFKYDLSMYLDAIGSNLPNGGEPDLTTYSEDIKRIEEIKKAKIGRMWMIRFSRNFDRSEALNQFLGAMKEFIIGARK